MNDAGDHGLAERRLRDLLAGGPALAALLVAHELKLFGFLGEAPRTLPEICGALNLKPRPAEALVALCAAAGLLTEGPDGYRVASWAAPLLLPRSPLSFGAYLDMVIEDARLMEFRTIREAILQDTPQKGPGGAGKRAMTLAMESRGVASSLVWPGLVDLAPFRVLLDVGGGSGVHAVGAVRRWPHLEAIVFDRPEACAVAQERISKHGLGDRIRTAPGDFFDPTPFPDADVHLYSEVLHNRSPDECRALLSKTFASLPPGGLVLVHEMLFEERLRGAPAVAAANLNMLVRTKGGRQYSVPELSGLLAECGFRDVEVVPAAAHFSLASARKPGDAAR